MGFRVRLSEYPYALPVLTALAAALPCFGFSYLWDDYFFLNHALRGQSIDFLPYRNDAFYRPLSRGLYFQLLAWAGDNGARLGHVLNACFLVAVVVLLVLLVQRLAGKRVGMFTGVAFAALAPTPFLVGWVSGVQDLLGMVFLLAALHFQLSRRMGAALAATTLSLLSKETAIVLVPVLASFDWILGRRPFRLLRQFAFYTSLVVLWAMVHPGVQRLLEHGLRSGATGYVGAEHPERWLPYLGRYVLTMLNIPTAAIDPAWIVERIPAFTCISLVAALGIAVQNRADHPSEGERQDPIGRLLILAGLLAALPLLLASTMLRVWAPYYAVYPSLGLSVLLGTAAAKMPAPRANIVLTAFFVMGFSCRAGKYDPGVQTEYNLSVTSSAVHKVEAGFKALENTLPRGTQVLVTVQAHGLSGIYTHLYLFQALRVWYRDPTLTTMRPDWRRPAPAQERLFWVSPDANVFEIDIRSKGARTSGPRPDYIQYQKTLRYYARGLTATGEIDHGLHILLRMPEPDYPSLVLDRRLAAMLLFAIGHDADAGKMLAGVPPVARGNALDIVSALLASPGGTLPWDDAALRAFSISLDDVAAWRQLMRGAANPLYASDGIRFAKRVLRLVPGDGEALAMIRRLSGHLQDTPIAVPAPSDWILGSTRLHGAHQVAISGDPRGSSTARRYVRTATPTASGYNLDLWRYRMKQGYSWRAFVVVAALLMAAPASAQYVFFDTNGDGVCNFSDVLTSAATSIDVYFDTNHNGDGSAASCPTGEPLSILSYEFIAHVIGAGNVTFGAFTNAMASMTTNLGTSSTASDYHTGFGGSTILPPGKYLVGTLAITVTGVPLLAIQSGTTLNAAYLTAFGSQCPGRDMDNKMKLGPNPGDVYGPGDFTSACGTWIPDDVKHTTWGVIKNLYKN